MFDAQHICLYVQHKQITSSSDSVGHLEYAAGKARWQRAIGVSSTSQRFRRFYFRICCEPGKRFLVRLARKTCILFAYFLHKIWQFNPVWFVDVIAVVLPLSIS